MTEFDFLASLPSVAAPLGLAILAFVVVLLDSYLPLGQRKNIAYVSGLGMVALAAAPLIWSPPQGGAMVWGGVLRHDATAQIFQVMVMLAGGLSSLMAMHDHGTKNRGEFHLIVIVSTFGGTLLAASNDLLMLFIALETVTIPLYISAAFARQDKRSSESGLKYFLFGSLASAVLLYGFSLLFGFTGQTRLDLIAAGLLEGRIIGDQMLPVLLAFLMVIVGFGFKVSMAPFHFWTPDVYEGSPTPVTAFVSVASKAASFGVLVRFMLNVFPPELMIDGQLVQGFWVNTLVVISIVSMTLGNVLALRQTNIKRMLAYSSIAQAGYTLIGVAALQAADPTYAVSSVAFYMFMYTFSNLLIFTCVIIFTEATGSEQISDFGGLQRRNPWLALGMTIGLLSLAGFPPAAGFFGKLFLFQASVDAGLVGLAVVGVLNSTIALYYYLVVIKIMYVDQHPDQGKPISLGRPYGWLVGVGAVAVLLLGILPTPIIDWARLGAQSIAMLLINGF